MSSRVAPPKVLRIHCTMPLHKLPYKLPLRIALPNCPSHCTGPCTPRPRRLHAPSRRRADARVQADFPLLYRRTGAPRARARLHSFLGSTPRLSLSSPGPDHLCSIYPTLTPPCSHPLPACLERPRAHSQPPLTPFRAPVHRWPSTSLHYSSHGSSSPGPWHSQ